MTGLESVDDGEIFFGDRMVQSLPAHESKAGLVFQDLGLWPGLTVIDNVGFPLKVQRMRAERRRKVAEALSSLRIDSLASRRPEQLSALQRLRTALSAGPGVVARDSWSSMSRSARSILEHARISGMT